MPEDRDCDIGAPSFLPSAVVVGFVIVHCGESLLYQRRQDVASTQAVSEGVDGVVTS